MLFWSVSTFASGSYDARVRILLVMEFMMSLEGAFIMTSRVKFVGSSLASPRYSLNSFSCFFVGYCPNRSRNAVFANPNSCSPIESRILSILWPLYQSSPSQGCITPSLSGLNATIFDTPVNPVRTPFPLRSLRPLFTLYSLKRSSEM